MRWNDRPIKASHHLRHGGPFLWAGASPADQQAEPWRTGGSGHPQGTTRFASHLFRTGVLKTEPRSWTDYFLPVAHNLAGT